MSFGKDKQQQQQTSVAQGQTFVDPRQVPFLDITRRAALNVAGSQFPGITTESQQLAQTLGAQGSQFLNELQSGSVNAQDIPAGILEAAGQSLDIGQFGGVGNPLLESAAAGAPQLLQQNPGLAGTLQALQDAIQNNLAATSGTIAGQATLGGSTGGSRQALATGLAAQESERAFGAGASQLIGQEFAARQNLAPQLLGIQAQAGQALNANQLQALSQGGQLATGASAAASEAIRAATGAFGAESGARAAGLESLQPLFNLGLAPFQAQFSPLLNLAAILGDPTVLQTTSTRSQGTGSSSSFNVGSGGFFTGGFVG